MSSVDENAQDEAVAGTSIDQPDTEVVDNELTDDEFHGEDEEAPKRRSPYWANFSGSGQRFAKCNHCSRKYKISGKSNGGTGNLSRHMRKDHSNIAVVETVDLGPFVFSQEVFREKLMKWVVVCDQPYTAPSDKEFIELVHSLNPAANVYSDKTIKADELSEYLKKFDELKGVVAKVPGKISLSMDGWTSKNLIPFLAIRGHWLDSEWNYQSKLLDFAFIEGEHTGEKHSKILTDVLTRLEIPYAKILAITLDNAANNDTLFDFLESHGITVESNQVRCMAHIINLGAQDILASLKVPSSYDDIDPDQDLDNEELADIDLNVEVDDDELAESDELDVDLQDGSVIDKLRKLVRKIRRSVQLRQKLKKICESYNMTYLVPIIDIVTRWNSTYHMISRAETLRQPLRALCQNEKCLTKYCIGAIEWMELQKVQTLLEKFERSTKLMSMERHSTISSYLPTLNWLIEVLKDYIDENDDALAEAVKHGLTKLQKYETLINDTTLPFVAVFLNPALKMNHFKEYYSRIAVRDINTKIISYFTKNYPTTSVTHSSKRKADDDDFHNHLFKRSKQSNEPTEIKKYLDAPLVDPEIDMCDYWKSRQHEFPSLSTMARDFLPVSVERVFSSAVDVVTPKRCRLTEKTIQAKMCLKSWLKK